MSGSSGADPRWVAADPVELVWVRWTDGAAVLHRPSGKTHFLNPASVYLLDQLSRAPLTASEAGTSLAQHECVQADHAYLTQVEATLFRFGQLGLARCLRS